MSEDGIARRSKALEIDNILAATNHLIAIDNVDAAGLAGIAAADIFDMRGPYQEGAELMQRILALPALDTHIELKLTWRLGHFMSRSGRWDESMQTFQKLLDKAIALGETEEEAFVRGQIGEMLHWVGRTEEAHTSIEKSTKLFEDLGNFYGLAQANRSLGGVHREEGNLDQAKLYFEKSLAISREYEYPLIEAGALRELSEGCVYRHG